ncbi:hypothetical protein [Nostoc sp. 106C]|uniref:hypothetical protein n=1 Tax=Nostoc sp. 106C TaxID=1932667 RepID=UPI000A399A08|nr:hypothetical protein [Nostoc sp. 106C]OUL28795.1 hypothetical protein BV375_16895 [Nostoc sp. 106C]
MTYRADLKPWGVFRCESTVQNVCVNRFRARSDAEAYMSILRGLNPGVRFEVVFDKPVEVSQG